MEGRVNGRFDIWQEPLRVVMAHIMPVFGYTKKKCPLIRLDHRLLPWESSRKKQLLSNLLIWIQGRFFLESDCLNSLMLSSREQVSLLSNLPLDSLSFFEWIHFSLNWWVYCILFDTTFPIMHQNIIQHLFYPIFSMQNAHHSICLSCITCLLLCMHHAFWIECIMYLMYHVSYA